ncbi:hypothetical protein [Emcibacter nanhaiensis]|uniref:Uncharacterized protein n=1 Tax=Emcibacter nanhaiensis TaxID=1505037 RepID=A0A501P9W5_9PROT|nr:hypothetical protein [Emcibacter nanhaiensis]TPD56836.1 hypothetical protein FIV46_17855 [Emcibacter nanhaiensis]
MKFYPIEVPRTGYRGANLAKQKKTYNRNRVATLVEHYINTDLSTKPNDTIHQYHSAHIAQELGEDSKLVHDVIFATDGGSNGITIVKGDYERAMEALHQPKDKTKMAEEN